MTGRIEALAATVAAQTGGKLARLPAPEGELAYRVEPGQLREVCQVLRDDPALRFEMLMDLAGVDYLTYGRDEWQTESATRTGFSRGCAPGLVPGHSDSHGRFAVAYQLLSIAHRRRLRLRCYCEGGDAPMVDSVIGIWAAANWFEREAFDLFGILFHGHPDLRRLLTDYGFIGHPFRKDFPLSGNVEVRYDEAKKRVIYQPVTIEPRQLVPRVIREDQRYNEALRSK